VECWDILGVSSFSAFTKLLVYFNFLSSFYYVQMFTFELTQISFSRSAIIRDLLVVLLIVF
jgi:hypothetical protein